MKTANWRFADIGKKRDNIQTITNNHDSDYDN